MKQFLREKPVFKKHDLVKGENIFYTKFDIILCRNVMIYFNSKLQNRVFDLFHKSLNDNGYLIMGIHESILVFANERVNYNFPLLAQVCNLCF